MFSNFPQKFEPFIEQYNSSGDLMLQRYPDETLNTGLWRIFVQNTLLLRYPAVKAAFELNLDLVLPLDYPDDHFNIPPSPAILAIPAVLDATGAVVTPAIARLLLLTMVAVATHSTSITT